MTEARQYRRVVTGLDAEGRSCVIIDEPIAGRGISSAMVWRTGPVPVDNSGTADAAVPYAMEHLHDGGTNFMLVELPVGMGRFMHATDTIDYIVVLEGSVTLELEAGDATLHAGDFIVDRGVLHSWRNDGPETAVMASITIPALPVGKGRTV